MSRYGGGGFELAACEFLKRDLGVSCRWLVGLDWSSVTWGFFFDAETILPSSLFKFNTAMPIAW